MKRNPDDDQKLSSLLKENGLQKMDEAIAMRLRHTIVATYRKRESTALVRNQWPARIILLLSVLSCVLLLYYMTPILMNPVAIMAMGLIIGLWAVIFLFLRFSGTRPTDEPLKKHLPRQ